MDVLVENLARAPLDWEVLMLAAGLAVAVMVVVPLLKGERDPTDLALDDTDLQLWMTFEYPRPVPTVNLIRAGVGERIG